MKKISIAATVLVLVALITVVYSFRVRLKEQLNIILKPPLPEAQPAVYFSQPQKQPQDAQDVQVQTAASPQIPPQPVTKPLPQPATGTSFQPAIGVSSQPATGTSPQPKAETLLQTGIETLPPSVNLAVPFASQSPFADWNMPYQEACEEAAAIMVHYYYEGKSLSPTTMNEEILKLIEWETTTFGYYQDTTAAEIARILREYFGYQNVEIRYDFTIDDIKREVAQGRPVIVPAAGRLLPNPNFRRPGPIYHALVIKGYTSEKIITNDPGTRNGRDFLYTPEVLMHALHEWDASDILNGKKAMIVARP